jgi:uncharacterized glyoxalase superfamily protein PhnB
MSKYFVAEKQHGGAAMAAEHVARPPVIPAVIYKDRHGAIDFLQKAFGLELALLLTDAAGDVAHAEMNFGGGVVMIASEWPAWVWAKSPGSAGGVNTQFIRIQLERDIDAHCERARAAGARIIEEPRDEFYGDRIYRAMDLEGHFWTFAQPVRQVTFEEMERDTGYKLETP